jgi:FkbM family methyltransferase
VWYGNKYGGFYIHPNIINSNSVVYSFGIGEDISFDEDVMRIHNCNVYGFDPTPKSINWINSKKRIDKFKFFNCGIDTKDGFVDFFLPKNSGHVSGSVVSQKNVSTLNKLSVEMKSLTKIMDELGHQHIDVLKMDIEGSEYDVIENILNSKISITQFLIEFHDRFFPNGKAKTKQIIGMFKRHGYEIFAISDSFEEVSFIDKKVLGKL